MTTKIKLSNWVAEWLVGAGIEHVFMLTGGGAMHLNHSIGTDPRLTTTFCHHDPRRGCPTSDSRYPYSLNRSARDCLTLPPSTPDT